MADSLKKRYAYKLRTNIVGAMISAVTQLMIPRGLGPKNYGDFNFLNNFFIQLMSFFDNGTSTCFYTKLSQRPKEFKLRSFYLYFSCAVFVFTICFVVFAEVTGMHYLLWPEQMARYVYLAACLGILVWITNILSQMADAYGITVSLEVNKLFQKAAGLFIIIALFANKQLNLLNFFIYNCFLSAMLVVALLRVMYKSGYILRTEWTLKWTEVKKYSLEFYRYSHPIFFYSMVAMVVNILDIWLLQVLGGSVQQGFFGLSNQVGAICFLFTSAMTPLIMREFSMAYARQDLKQMAGLFRRHIPLLFSITVFITSFVAVNADRVAIIIGGGKFRDAYLAVAIMSLYPVYRVYGQLSDSLFFATDRTRTYRNIGISFSLLGLPLTYFMLAPRKIYGLDMGANGLAIKTVLMAFMTINVLLYANSKYLKISFWKYLLHQIVSILLFLSVAAAVRAGVVLIMRGGGNALADILISGVIYTVISAVIFFAFPVIFGLKREDTGVVMSYLSVRRKR